MTIKEWEDWLVDSGMTSYDGVFVTGHRVVYSGKEYDLLFLVRPGELASWEALPTGQRYNPPILTAFFTSSRTSGAAELCGQWWQPVYMGDEAQSIILRWILQRPVRTYEARYDFKVLLDLKEHEILTLLKKLKQAHGAF